MRPTLFWFIVLGIVLFIPVFVVSPKLDINSLQAYYLAIFILVTVGGFLLNTHSALRLCLKSGNVTKETGAQTLL